MRNSTAFMYGNIGCFIELSLFDCFTGETFSKDCLEKTERDKVTACEEMLKLLDGAPEEDLLMTVEEIKSNLTAVYEGFKQCNEDCTAHGYTPMKDNLDGEQAFKEAVAFLENMEVEKENAYEPEL